MPKKIKLNLNELNVESFQTTHIKGGGSDTEGVYCYHSNLFHCTTPEAGCIQGSEECETVVGPCTEFVCHTNEYHFCTKDAYACNP